MASLTIRNLDNQVKARLRVRAAQHGRSMEAEAREILKAGLTGETAPSSNLAETIRRIVEPVGGLELRLPRREPARRRVDFSR